MSQIIELPDIVQSLQNKQWTGTLEILSGEEDTRSTCLFFRNGMIQHASPDRNALVLGRALYELRLIDEADYRLTLHAWQQHGGKSVGEVLVDLGLVDQGDIQKALLFQGREHVLDVFTWDHVDVKFHAGEEALEERFSPQQREVSLNLAGMSILMEAARRVDEWKIVHETISSEHDVVARTSENGNFPADAISPRTVLLIDGYRSAYEVAREAPHDTLEVLQQLGELVKQGLLKCLEPPDLVQVGMVAEQDEDYEKALRVYELASQRGLDHLDLHRRVARVYSLLGRSKVALEKWVAVAERCVKVDRRDLAISALQEAIGLDPADLTLRHRLVGLLVEAQASDEAAAQLRPLIAMAEKDQAEPELIIELMNQFLEFDPEDEEILERLSSLHLEQGNKLEAMVVLDDLATVHTTHTRLEDAVSVYYRILDIDAENLQARLLLAQNLTKLGSTDDAVREYRRLADILYKSGVIGNSINWPFLIKVYESIVELEPSSTAAWEWLAKAYLENGQQDLAISRYLKMADSLEPPEGEQPPPEILNPLRRVVKLDPQNLEVRRRLANTHLGLNQTERAVRCFRELAEQALQDELVDQARIAYDEALEHNPFDMDSRRGLAAIQEQHGDYEEAYRSWKAIGGMCHRAGLFEAAVKDFHRAFQIKNDDPETVKELAQIEEARGRDKNSAMLYARYAQLLISRNDLGAAQEALETAGRLEPNLPQVAELMSRLTAARS